MSQVQKSGTTSVVVDAPIHDVWRVVSDVTRVGDWSHECRSAHWLSGAGTAAAGVRFRGRNRAGWARWTRTCEVVVVDEPRDFVWRTLSSPLFPDSTVWRIHLERAGQGTRITQRFEVVRAPWLLDRVYAWLIPSHQDRDVELRSDLMRIGPAARTPRQDTPARSAPQTT